MNPTLVAFDTGISHCSRQSVLLRSRIIEERFIRIDAFVDVYISDNEQVTLKKNKDNAYPADAVLGAAYFDITVSLCRPDGHTVILRLMNDTPDAHYYLSRYRIS